MGNILKWYRYYFIFFPWFIKKINLLKIGINLRENEWNEH